MPTQNLPSPAPVYTLAEFCAAHRISRQHYYSLKNRGIAPAEIHLGRRVLISTEAAAEWRERMTDKGVAA